MDRLVLRRLGQMFVTLWVIATSTFFLMHALPGTPLQNEERLPVEIREQILRSYGLDRPLLVQYLRFLGQLLHGDLGRSLAYDGRSVNQLISEGFLPSAWIGSQALLFGIVVGVTLGIVAAYHRGRWPDWLVMGVAVGGVSVPNFLLGALLSYGVGVKAGWLPSGLWGGYLHTILPSLSLAVMVIAQLSRYVRMEAVKVLAQPYLKTAIAKGLHPVTILRRYVLRNALIPAITIVGPLSVNLLTGSLVIEQIFSIPGMGSLYVQSILAKDLTMIMGMTIFYSLLFVTLIFISDLLSLWIDPRIQTAPDGR
jgi:oligopeptide transport system permease protein